jgi:ureidoglycolate lyase
MIIVAPSAATADPASLRAFVSDGQQGVNLAKGIWQHPLIALKRRMNFLTLDRAGPGRNREQVSLDDGLQVNVSF